MTTREQFCEHVKKYGMKRLGDELAVALNMMNQQDAELANLRLQLAGRAFQKGMSDESEPSDC